MSEQVWPPPEPPPAEDPTLALSRRLGHVFADLELLRRALTHRSWLHESGGAGDAHYERLEFLGDSVFGLLTAEWLFERFPESAEGELAKLKSVLVSASVLDRHARRLGIGAVLRLGIGEERTGGRRKASILADAMEAVLGAVFLDGGLPAARTVVRPLLEAALADRHLDRPDAKTELQELAQARGWPLPSYRIVGEEGPDHRKTFTVECRVGELAPVTAAGPSKKVAEQQAAVVALGQLRGGSE